MRKAPAFNKGRYSKNGSISKQESECIRLKTALRKEFLDEFYKDEGELFQPYYGHGILQKTVYDEYTFTRNHKCDKVIKEEGVYHGDCERYIEQTELSNVAVADFDHHGLPTESIALFFKMHAPEKCILFATYGLKVFQFRPVIFEKR